MNRTQIAVALIAITATSAATLYYFNFYQETSPEQHILKIYCAGSLLYPMEQVAEAFMEQYPDITVQIEGHGSIQVIRHPVELNDPADLLMVADYSLIPIMMYKAPLPDGSGNFTDWYIRFAGNELVLAYTNQSLYKDELTSKNWYTILARPDVKLGISNPIIDALGYRGLQVLQLAEYYCGEPQIFETVIGTWFDPEIKTVEVDEKTAIFVPEVEDPNEDKISMRASSIQIMPLLETGALDYSFLYKSNAEQHGLNYLTLPNEINMGNPDYDTYYAKAQVKFQHQRFQSIGLDRYGKTIYYGLTIPETAENPEDAVLMIAFILGGEGKTIFEELDHSVYMPAYADNIGGVPEELKQYLTTDYYK